MLRRSSKVVVTALVGLAVVSRLKGGKTGTLLGIPYDWRRPTVARAKSRLWNPDEPRVLVPRVFGMGWDVNLARLLGRRPRG